MKSFILLVLICFPVLSNAQYGPADSLKANEREYTTAMYAYDIGFHSKKASTYMIGGTVVALLGVVFATIAANNDPLRGAVVGGLFGVVGIGLNIAGISQFSKIEKASMIYYEQHKYDE